MVPDFAQATLDVPPVVVAVAGRDPVAFLTRLVAPVMEAAVVGAAGTSSHKNRVDWMSSTLTRQSAIHAGCMNDYLCQPELDGHPESWWFRGRAWSGTYSSNLIG